MEKVEQYIKERTRNDSNTSRGWHNRGVSIPTTYTPWVVPNVAREAAKIAREETIKEVYEWLDNHTMLSEKWYIEDLKKHFEGKL